MFWQARVVTADAAVHAALHLPPGACGLVLSVLRRRRMRPILQHHNVSGRAHSCRADEPAHFNAELGRPFTDWAKRVEASPHSDDAPSPMMC